MSKKQGELWKIFTENIYRRDQEERIRQAFELLVPELAQAVYEKERRKKIDQEIVNSKSDTKTKKAQ